MEGKRLQKKEKYFDAEKSRHRPDGGFGKERNVSVQCIHASICAKGRRHVAGMAKGDRMAGAHDVSEAQIGAAEGAKFGECGSKMLFSHSSGSSASSHDAVGIAGIGTFQQHRNAVCGDIINECGMGDVTEIGVFQLVGIVVNDGFGAVEDQVSDISFAVRNFVTPYAMRAEAKSK